MSIVNVKKGWSKRSASKGAGGTSIVDYWTVLTDDPADDGLDVFSASGLPDYGDSHPEDAFLKVTKIDPRPRGPTLWDVLVTYSTPTITDGGGNNPLDVPPVFRWEGRDILEPVDFDAAGEPVKNTVDEVFDPPLQREFTDLVLTIERNQAAFSPGNIVSFQKTTNAQWFLVPPGQALMGKIIANENFFEPDNGTPFVYYEVVYEIIFRKAGAPPQGQVGSNNNFLERAARAWWKRVLNAGTREYVSDRLWLNAAGDPVPDSSHPSGFRTVKEFRDIVSKDGRRVTSPVPLTEDGYQLAEGEDPYWLEFQWYPSANWGPLSLPVGR